MKDVHKRCAFCKYWKYIGQIDLVCMRKRGTEYMKDKKWDDTCKHFERVEDAETRDLSKALGVLSSYCSKHYHPPTDDGERGCDRDCIFINKVYGDCWFEDGESLYPEQNIASLSLDEMREWHNNEKVEGFRKFLEWRKSQKEDI